MSTCKTQDKARAKHTDLGRLDLSLTVTQIGSNDFFLSKMQKLSNSGSIAFTNSVPVIGLTQAKAKKSPFKAHAFYKH